MRRLNIPNVDDTAVLLNLTDSGAAAATQLRPHLASLDMAYRTYRNFQGNPWFVTKNAQLQPLKVNLLALYETPPIALGFIGNLRDSASGACPVCGRDGLGTLDHYLPKADYAEFSFFSKNLIPACSRCNSARSNLVRGTIPDHRPIHPYYDAFLSRQILTTELRPDWRAPAIKAVPFDVAGSTLATVQWHIENVINPSGFEAYVIDIWGKIIDRPADFFEGKIQIRSIKKILTQLCKIECINGGSLNTWKAALYHGILNNPDALQYIQERIRQQIHTSRLSMHTS